MKPNFGKVTNWAVLAASVMILVTFVPETAVSPLTNFVSQLRMNNVSATQAAEDQASVLDAVKSAAKRTLR